MRKRDRLRIAKQLGAMADEVYRLPLQQLFGAQWYFENGADIKGFNSAYAALSWLQKHAKDLNVLLKKASKLDDPSPRKPKKK